MAPERQGGDRPPPSAGPGAPGWAAPEPAQPPRRESKPAPPLSLILVSLGLLALGAVVFLKLGPFAEDKPFTYTTPSQFKRDDDAIGNLGGLDNRQTLVGPHAYIAIGAADIHGDVPATLTAQNIGFRQAIQQLGQALGAQTNTSVGPVEDVTLAGRPALRLVVIGHEKVHSPSDFQAGNLFFLVAHKRAYVIMCLAEDSINQVAPQCDTVLDSFEPGD